MVAHVIRHVESCFNSEFPRAANVKEYATQVLGTYMGSLHGRPIRIPPPTGASRRLLHRPRLPVGALIPALIPALVATPVASGRSLQPLMHASAFDTTACLHDLVCPSRAGLLCLSLVLMLLLLLLLLLLSGPFLIRQRLQPPAPGWLGSFRCCWDLFYMLRLSWHSLRGHASTRCSRSALRALWG